MLADMVTGILGSEVSPTQPLMAAVMDSLAAVELRNAIGSTFSITLPATLAFDFPTLTAIADHVASQALPAEEQADEEASWEGPDGRHDDFPDAEEDDSVLDSTASMSDLLRTTTTNLQSIVASIAGEEVGEAQPMVEVSLYAGRFQLDGFVTMHGRYWPCLRTALHIV